MDLISAEYAIDVSLGLEGYFELGSVLGAVGLDMPVDVAVDFGREQDGDIFVNLAPGNFTGATLTGTTPTLGGGGVNVLYELSDFRIENFKALAVEFFGRDLWGINLGLAPVTLPSTDLEEWELLEFTFGSGFETEIGGEAADDARIDLLDGLTLSSKLPTSTSKTSDPLISTGSPPDLSVIARDLGILELEAALFEMVDNIPSLAFLDFLSEDFKLASQVFGTDISLEATYSILKPYIGLGAGIATQVDFRPEDVTVEVEIGGQRQTKKLGEDFSFSGIGKAATGTITYDLDGALDIKYGVGFDASIGVEGLGISGSLGVGNSTAEVDFGPLIDLEVSGNPFGQYGQREARDVWLWTPAPIWLDEEISPITRSFSVEADPSSGWSGGGGSGGGDTGSGDPGGGGSSETDIPQGSENYGLSVTAVDKDLIYGSAIPLIELYPSSGWSDTDGSYDIIYFAVADRDIGGGYLTKDGAIIESGEVHEDAISNIGRYAFVAASSFAEDEIGFNVIDSKGDFSPSLAEGVAAMVTSVAPLVGDGGSGGGEVIDNPDESGTSGGRADLVPNIRAIEVNNAFPGEEVKVRFETSNVGQRPALVHDTAVYLSRDLDPSGSELVGIKDPGTIAEGETEPGSVKFDIPSGARGTYNIIVVADYEERLTENDENNNSAVGTLTVGAPPFNGPNIEFEIFHLRDSTLVHDQSVIVDWELRNTGGEASERSSVSLYLSANRSFDPDDDIRIAEQPFGSRPVGGVSEGIDVGEADYETEEIAISAAQVAQLRGSSDPTNLYLLYVIDEDRDIFETDRADNVVYSRFSIAASEAEIIGYTDFVAESFSISTGRLAFNQPFFASVTLKNDGTIDFPASGYAADLTYRSVETGEVERQGSLIVGRPEQFIRGETFFASARQELADGRFEPGFYDVFVHARPYDDEPTDRQFNNYSNSVRVFIGSEADIARLDSADPAVGNLNVTRIGADIIDVAFDVSNEGYVPLNKPVSISGTAISPDGLTEVPLFAIDTPGLPASDPEANVISTITQRVSLASMVGQGAFDLRVSVRTEGANLDTSNDLVKLADAFTVDTLLRAFDDRATIGEGDWIILPVLANDMIDPNAEITLTAAAPIHGDVQNMGTYFLYRSANDFTGTDHFAYTIREASGGSDTAMVEIEITPANDLNNLLPDVAISDLAVSDTAWSQDEPVSFSWTTENIGPVSTRIFGDGIFLSPDPIITADDVRLASGDSLYGLMPGETKAGSRDITIDLTGSPFVGLDPGTYYAGVIADDSNAVSEGNKANNVSNAVQVAIEDKVSSSPADLVATNLYVPYIDLKSGEGTPAFWTTRNIGADDVGYFEVGLYLSTDLEISTDDILLSVDAIEGLRAGETVRGGASISLPAPLAAGSYYIGAIADFGSMIDEAVENNNGSNVVEVKVDPAASRIGESGVINVSQASADEWARVRFSYPLDDPAVVMGPLSYNGSQPATVRIRDVTNFGFKFQLDEWDYLDGFHAPETLSWLAVEAGTHTLETTDQVLRAGSMFVGDKSVEVGLGDSFDAAFSSVPVVFSQIVTINGSQAATTRISEVSGSSFQVRIQEEEGNDGFYVEEEVDWIAVEQGGFAGQTSKWDALVLSGVTDDEKTIFIGSSHGRAPAVIADMQTFAGTDPATVRYTSIDTADDTEISLFIEEEQSADLELRHTREDVGIFALKTGALTGETKMIDAIGEARTIMVSQAGPGDWTKVSFTQALDDPSVVMRPLSFNGPQPAAVRVRHVTENGFEFQIDEWDYLDGSHITETVGFLAIESGSHTLADGTQVRAGSTVANHTFTDVSYGETGKTPIALSQIVTFNGTQAATTRLQDVNSTGFKVSIQEEEGNDGFHANEEIDWIAITPGSTAGRHVALTGDVVTHTPQSFGFDGFFTGEPAAPVLLADMQTFDGTDPATLRATALNTGGATLFVEEEKSADSEIGHTTEVVGIAAFEDGLIFS